MNYLFKSLRPINLLMIFFTQIIAVYFLGFKNSIVNIFDNLHLSIYISTVLTAAAAYIFNDITDRKCDEINNPEKNFLSQIFYKKLFIVTYFILSLFALIVALVTSVKLSIWVLFLQILLILYNLLLKKLPILGNILVSLITAFSIYIFNIFDPNIKVNLVIIFSIYAFGINLIREIIKDAEDIEGDSISGRYTFPVIAGYKATRILLLFLIFFYVLIVTTCVRLMVEKYFSYPLNLVFITYNVVCIGFPIFHLSMKTQYAVDKNDFEYLGKIAKYVMVTGILSMMFF